MTREPKGDSVGRVALIALFSIMAFLGFVLIIGSIYETFITRNTAANFFCCGSLLGMCIVFGCFLQIRLIRWNRLRLVLYEKGLKHGSTGGIQGIKELVFGKEDFIPWTSINRIMLKKYPVSKQPEDIEIQLKDGRTKTIMIGWLGRWVGFPAVLMEHFPDKLDDETRALLEEMARLQSISAAGDERHD